MRVTKVSAPPRPVRSRRPLGGLSLPGPGWRRREKAERRPAPGAVQRVLGVRGGKRLRVIVAGVLLLTLLMMTGAPGWALSALGRSALALTAGLGLTVEEVLLDGRVRSDGAAVRDAIRVEIGAPLLGVDVGNVMRRLEQLPWVKSAAVERRLPRTLHVALTEREPLALWQPDDATLLVVDRDGVPVKSADPLRYAFLPLLVGERATDAADELFRLLADEADTAVQVQAAIRVGARRWDLRLKQGVTLMLPAQAPAEALAQFRALDALHGLSGRALDAIDLRDPARPVVRTRDGVNETPVAPGAPDPFAGAG